MAVLSTELHHAQVSGRVKDGPGTSRARFFSEFHPGCALFGMSLEILLCGFAFEAN